MVGVDVRFQLKDRNLFVLYLFKSLPVPISPLQFLEWDKPPSRFIWK